jgi:hypothetical protein
MMHEDYIIHAMYIIILRLVLNIPLHLDVFCQMPARGRIDFQDVVNASYCHCQTTHSLWSSLVPGTNINIMASATEASVSGAVLWAYRGHLAIRMKGVTVWKAVHISEDRPTLVPVWNLRHEKRLITVLIGIILCDKV